MINAAMKDWDFIEQAAVRRVDQVRRIHESLIANELPVLSPASGHCIVLDVEEYMGVEQYKNPTISFIAKIYSETGIRGGRHLIGIAEENRKIHYVRFAIPLCMPDEEVDAMTYALVSVLKTIDNLPDMIKTSSIPGLTGMLYAHYKPVYISLEDDKLQAQV
jgi:tryptophanase